MGFIYISFQIYNPIKIVIACSYVAPLNKAQFNPQNNLLGNLGAKRWNYLLMLIEL